MGDSSWNFRTKQNEASLFVRRTGFLPHVFLAFEPIVDSRFAGLRVLVTAVDAVHAPVFYEPRPGLVEAEGDVCRHALFTQPEHPGVVARPGLVALFAARRDLLDGGREIACDVERSQQRGADDEPVADRRREEQQQPVIGHRLIFDRAADDDILISVAPVGRQYGGQPVNALGEEEEPQVVADAHHLPGLGTPGVGLLQQKIRCEAGVDHLAGGDLEPSVAATAHRTVEHRRLPHFAAVFVVAAVLPVDIAVAAAFADFPASVPGVPRNGHGYMNSMRRRTMWRHSTPFSKIGVGLCLRK